MPSSSLSEMAVPAAVDEVTPLLGAVQPVQAKDNAPPQYSPYDAREDAPIPKTQVFLLCYARLVEPVAFFTIFPFINKMIMETGNMEEADVGFYTGLVV